MPAIRIEAENAGEVATHFMRRIFETTLEQTAEAGEDEPPHPIVHVTECGAPRPDLLEWCVGVDPILELFPNYFV